MGLLDKLLGRTKPTAGDAAGDSSLRREGGVHQEGEGAAEDRAPEHEEVAQEGSDETTPPA